jgi:hypothetical protein
MWCDMALNIVSIGRNFWMEIDVKR